MSTTIRVFTPYDALREAVTQSLRIPKGADEARVEELVREHLKRAPAPPDVPVEVRGRTVRMSPEAALVGLFCVGAFLREGEQVYVLPKDTQRAFERTRVDDPAVLEHLKLPHKALWVDLPGTALKVFNPESGYHPLVGFWLLELELLRPGEQGWAVVAWGRPRKGNPADDALTHLLLRFPQLKAAGSLSAFHRKSWAVDWRGGVPHLEVGAEDPNVGVREACVQYALNLCLFLLQRQPDVEDVTAQLEQEKQSLRDSIARVKTGAKREAKRQQLRQLGAGQPRVRIIGPRVCAEIERRYREAADDDGAKRKVSPHMRAGHWRLQPYGPKKDAQGNPLVQARMSVWIQPVLVAGVGGTPPPRITVVKTA